jgi:acyl-CoA synthetase (AMP-forming)/AMP-acid ligase II
MELTIGNIGEIIVSGSHVLREYLNNPEALRRNKIFIEDTCWHRTGDSGYIDKIGNLYLTGRCSTLITKDKKIIAPFIYESYFQSIEGVEIGTILKVNDKIIAILEINKAADKELVIAKIDNYGEKIDEIKFLGAVPRDPRHNSKIDYNLLCQLIRFK